MNQYVVFYQYYGSREIKHYSLDIEPQNSAELTMDKIYIKLKDWVGHNDRFIITSITKLN